MSIRKELFSNFTYISLDTGIVCVVGYLFYILMGKMLSPSEYGILMTVMGIYMILHQLTSLGFYEVAPRFIPILDNKKTKSCIYFLLKYSLIFSFIIGIIIFFLAEWVSVNVYSNTEFILPLKFLSVLVVSGSIYLVCKGIFQGLKKFKLSLMFDIIVQIFRLVIPVILVVYGFGIIGGIIGWIICFGLFFLLSGIYFFKKLSFVESANVNKEMVFYGIMSAITTAGMWLIIQSSVLILSFLDIVETGLFSVVHVFGMMFLFLPTIVSGLLLPYISQLYSEKNIDKINQIVKSSLKNIFLLSLIGIMGLYLFSDFIIAHIYTAEYLGANIFILPFTFGITLLGMSTILLMVLYVMGYPKLRLKLIIGTAIIDIALSYGLAMLVGNIGVVYGFLISQFILFILSVYFCRKYGIHLPNKLFDKNDKIFFDLIMNKLNDKLNI